MPVIGGKVVRARYNSLKLDEISSVDNPAQPGATASICKRHEPEVQKASGLARLVWKYVDSDDGAHTFQQVLTANNFDDEVWPMVSALSQSISSIMGDSALSATERQTKVQQSVDEFLAAVRQIDPPADPAEASQTEKVEKTIREATSAKPKPKKDPTMKTVEQLEAEVATLKGQLEAATGRATAAETTLKTEQEAHATTKAALATATEEVYKTVDGVEVKKSEAGAMFPVIKASDERARTAVYKSRAQDEFSHLPGTLDERASALKAVDAIPDENAKKAALAVFTAAEQMASKAFETLGSHGETPTLKAARTSFTEKVAEIRKNQPEMPEHEAMSKARRDYPDLYSQAYEQAA